MRFHAEACRDAYDVVVVGSGMGGLTAGALLARAGRSVLVVERHDRVGGYAHAFRRGRRVFDAAVHLVGGAGPGGLLRRLLAALDLEERVQLLPADPVYAVRGPGIELHAPAGLRAFEEAHRARFPREEKGLRELLAACRAAREESERAAALASPMEALGDPQRFPVLRRYRRATLARVLEAHLEDPHARAALAALWPYLGLPPSRVSFLYWAAMLTSYVEEGAAYCRGSFQRLADGLAHALRERGGEVLLRSPVRRIRVEEGRVAGVTLENGQRVGAPVVVSNADLRQTVEELVGGEAFPARYRAELRRLTPSVSARVAYLATREDLGARGLAHENFLYDDPNFERAFAGVERDRPGWLTVTVPTRLDPSLAPRGEQLAILTTLVEGSGRAGGRAAKAEGTERLLAAAEARLPGLRENLVFSEAATPRTLERYTRNDSGALYGWALEPGQVGPTRPGPETPLPGLLLAGHWTRPGGGVYGVVASGLEAARRITGTPTPDALLEGSGGTRSDT